MLSPHMQVYLRTRDRNAGNDVEMEWRRNMNEAQHACNRRTSEEQYPGILYVMNEKGRIRLCDSTTILR
ncbi:MAG: hypothetical protein AVDCRST_MAG26-3998 [uncultured Chloroflexia bacterium]|uniref:Uncharacterized protein n=1 Tax=uncultured Chloroflexia bacterium TaxID=1672391 RepID=A0A6J4JWS7_9CHLR|nr:MAG: hypothetical protein AVDCRST_MAG26-3998 [uncultured Chloroflexia bacterium]